VGPEARAENQATLPDFQEANKINLTNQFSAGISG
jgi:hypothetical protein